MKHEEFERLRGALIDSVLDGEGAAAPDLRRRAYSNTGLPNPLNHLIAGVASNSHAIENADVEAVERAGADEQQIFELVICAAVGEASRQYEAASRVLQQ